MKSRKKRVWGICLILMVALCGVIFFLYKFFIGSAVIRTSSKDYCNFEGFVGHSNLEVFPQNVTEVSKVLDYQYICLDTLMDPTCKIVMECQFEDEERFEAECVRLSQIAAEMDGEKNAIEYSEALFDYPAYVAIYDWHSCYEYALILEEEKKIVYVFLEGNWFTVPEEYMPKNTEYTDFSIYSFGGRYDLKYR